MEIARYWVGVGMVSFGPAAILLWLLVQPLIAFWRHVGAKITLAVNFAGMFLVVSTLISYRDVLMRGTSFVLAGFAVVLLTLSGVMRYFRNKVLPIRAIVGISELDPAGTESKLVVRGPYARVRQLRYIQLLVAFVAYTLFANYVTCHVVFVLIVTGGGIVVALEERELIERFGDTYRRYMVTTPRFVPRLDW